MEQRRHFAAEWETEDDAEAVSVGETTASGQNVTLEEREVNSTLLMVYNVLVIVQVYSTEKNSSIIGFIMCSFLKALRK